ncbi:MAG: peroxide stress protein YaaA [Candidatus Marinimicrobia bacterium]|nr:peroxide stress protein YaaA [Candidatus Neomarinimicrobiota bacterium]MBL7109477.1 peroxide stress protein YaaA [Candidatus Neomarinimicrobiota bacterium]
MNRDVNNINKNTLLIIPCCARKSSGGKPLPKNYSDPLSKYICPSAYKNLVDIRKDHIAQHIKHSDQYMPAIDRYNGNLYTAFPTLSKCIRNNTNIEGKPKLLILSALYGPLHPESLINDYNLIMPISKNGFWALNFPAFLSDYVNHNKIEYIRFYCGTSTGYYTVVNQSATPLLGGHTTLKGVTHCNVVNGNSYHTPYNHGLQLATDLGCGSFKFTRKVKCIANG